MAADVMDELTLLDAKAVAKLLRVSLPLIYKLSEQRRIPSIRIPCPGLGTRRKELVRFKKSDVLGFIDQNYRSRV